MLVQNVLKFVEMGKELDYDFENDSWDKWLASSYTKVA
jgi:hypothetical protein